MDEPSGFVFHYKYIEKGCRIKMEEKKTLLTYAGLTKLEEELHDLKVKKRSGRENQGSQRTGRLV